MTDRQRLREALLALADERGPTKTYCPSEAARRAFPEHWWEWMEATRTIAQALCDEGELECLQKGNVIDARQARGAIRLRRRA